MAEFYSPSQLLFGRALRDNLPTLEANLTPNIQNHGAFYRQMIDEKEKQKVYFDKRHNTREMPSLSPNQLVWVVDKKVFGRVVNQINQRRFVIQTEEENTIRRSRRFLRALPNDPVDRIESSVDVPSANDTCQPNHAEVIVQFINHDILMITSLNKTIFIFVNILEFLLFLFLFFILNFDLYTFILQYIYEKGDVAYGHTANVTAWKRRIHYILVSRN